MIIIVGASASGKTEIANYLMKHYPYHKCITTTTRSMREGEIQHRDYHFLSEIEFEHIISQNGFVETNEYQNHWYGLQKKDVIKNGVIVLEPNGTNHLIKQFQQQVYVCLIQSSLETRKQRMLKRHDENESMMRRLKEDDQIFHPSKFLKIDLTIQNESMTIEEMAQMVHHSYQNYLLNNQLEVDN
jgi:guanylate kinase